LEETGLLQKNYLYHDRYFTDIIYEVKEGDSLTRISEKFNIPLQRIIDLNFLGTTGVVEVGTILIIPVPAEFIYTVAPGETLADIAKKHGTTVEILLELNNIDLSVQLQGGEVLVLPGY
jgi:LysM repeat protein